MTTRVRIGLAVTFLLATAWLGSTLWRASRAIQSAERLSEVNDEIPITTSELRIANTGVEQIGAPSSFHDATVYKGRMYAGGPAGVFTEDKEYRVGDLLPPSPITTLSVGITSQSAEPELWIGAAGEGMLSFDGSRFRHVRPVDAKFRSVTSILPSTVGRVLFGTEKGGVLAYDGKTLRYLHDSLRDTHVTALAGSDTDLWVATIRGLIHYRGGQRTDVSGLPDPHVLSLVSSPDGAVYAGTALGIAIVRNNAVERVVADGLMAKAMLLRGSRLYAATLDSGVQEIPLDGGKPRFIDSSSPVYKLFEADGKIIAASDDGVFDLLRGESLLKPAAAILADRNISALSVDKLGRLWIGYFDRGLDILEADHTRARHLEDQHLFCVNRIVHDRNTAVATANGLVLFDATGQKRQVLGRDQGLIANHVTDVVFKGSEIIAATPAGLSFIDPGGVRSIYAFHGLVNNHAYALAVTQDRLLAGTLGGLSILDAGVVRVSYTTANSPLRHNWITAIIPSGSDTYVGTYGAGVIRFAADGSWQTFSGLPASAEINPGAMAASGTRVYAGTLGKGLLMYDSNDSRWHTITRGLPSLNVTAVHVADGRVFVGTDNGLVRLP